MLRIIGGGNSPGRCTFTGIFGEAYDIRDVHTKWGIWLTMIPAVLIIFFIQDSFQGLVLSQLFLSISFLLLFFFKSI